MSTATVISRELIDISVDLLSAREFCARTYHVLSRPSGQEVLQLLTDDDNHCYSASK